MPRFTKENITFTGINDLPEYWKVYFVLSTIGNTYTVIRDTETPLGAEPCDGCERITPDLVMSNTEYEYHTNQPFFDICAQYTNPKVLSVGYGIGLIIPEMESQGVDLTIIEKYQEILDLDPNLTQVQANHTVILGDIMTMDLSTLGTFDVIYTDTTEIITPEVKTELEGLLNPGGQLYQWKHDADMRYFNEYLGNQNN